LVDLDLKLKGMGAKIVCTMHMVKIDEIFVEAKSGIAETVVLILKDTMEEAGGALLKIAPVEAEVVVADSWAEK
jgi:DNA polymerase I-like protein with 3'-5' exonuclease and polymerase domains